MKMIGSSVTHFDAMIDGVPTITYFRGQWAKLGNYSPCLIFYDGHAYNSVEHAYQAQKSEDPGIQKIIRDAPTPAVAKRIARSVKLRPDWDTFKLELMLALLREKFKQEPERSTLLSTAGCNLVEGNWWGDKEWGQCPVGTGKNLLGQMLVQVRTEIWQEEVTSE